MKKAEFFEVYQKVKVEEYLKEETKVSSKPVVSVKISAFNHESYIEDCLKCVLNQKTTFPYEILLNEDDSADNTKEICKIYARKYPEKIRLFLHSSKNKIIIDGCKTGRFNAIFSYFESRGKYIAICDGDDIWTDKYKLQRQVDFLESHLKYTFCFHDFYILTGDSLKINDYGSRKDVNLYDVLWKMPNKSSTTMYRRSVLPFYNGEVPKIMLEAQTGDYPVTLFAALSGKGKYLNVVMAKYRIHSNSVFSSLEKKERLKKGIIMTNLLLKNCSDLNLIAKSILFFKKILFSIKQSLL